MMMFRDRTDAAQKLAGLLVEYRGKKDVTVVALPRGGVVIGRIVADALSVPLDIVVPRKIGSPYNEEYAIGAIAESGEPVWNESERATVDQDYINAALNKEKEEARRRLAVYRKDMLVRDLKDKITIIVDDGIATGLTMRAAIRSVRTEKPQKIVVATPVMSKDALLQLEKEVDRVVTVASPLWFSSVGSFFGDFPQVQDDEVIRLLRI